MLPLLSILPLSPAHPAVLCSGQGHTASNKLHLHGSSSSVPPLKAKSQRASTSPPLKAKSQRASTSLPKLCDFTGTLLVACWLMYTLCRYTDCLLTCKQCGLWLHSLWCTLRPSVCVCVCSNLQCMPLEKPHHLEGAWMGLQLGVLSAIQHMCMLT